MNRYIKLANVIFLIVLLANLVIPRGLGGRAYADPPPAWPFGNTFMEDTWVATSAALFGPSAPGEHTVFYATDQVVTGVGIYTGRNNLDQPFFLNVIRHYHAPQEKFASELSEAEKGVIRKSHHQRGVFWGTMWTAHGAANIIGLSMSFAPGTTSAGSAIPTQGILPVINHDLLQQAYVPPSPVLGAAGLSFGLLSEIGTGVFCDGLLPGDCLICLPPAQGLWCPCNDPAIQLAADTLAVELALCTAALAAAIGYAAISAIATAVRNCLILAPSGPVFLACLAVHALAFAVLHQIAMAAYAACVALCLIPFELAFT